MQRNYIFIDSFKSAQHVLGESFALLQEHFDCIYSFLEQYIDSAADRLAAAQSVHCSKMLYIQSAPENRRNCHPKHAEQT